MTIFYIILKIKSYLENWPLNHDHLSIDYYIIKHLHVRSVWWCIANDDVFSDVEIVFDARVFSWSLSIDIVVLLVRWIVVALLMVVETLLGLLLLLLLMISVCTFPFDFRWKIGDIVEFEIEEPRQVLVFIILNIICFDEKYVLFKKGEI